MWFFNSPEVAFGEDALSRLEELDGRRGFIVTDQTMVKLGFVARVQQHLSNAGLESDIFAEVEPDPSLQTVRRAAAAMAQFEPDWIIGLGGGSSLDAAKAAWFLYERPDLDPAAINPFESFGLRSKARLVAISTTSGTGAETTWAVVLTDKEENRKLGLATGELLPDLAIVDPSLAAEMPPVVTADTGLDVLTHAVEAYTSAWANDFSDGLALQAIKLVFNYLPRAFDDGSDVEARERMHNAAAIAGLAFSNGSLACAHALGHALGAVLGVPHGRAVGLFLPYTIEFVAKGGGTRYADIAHVLRLPAADEAEGVASLVAAVRELIYRVERPLSIAELGIAWDRYEAAVAEMVLKAETDTQLVTSLRIPDNDELALLFRHAYEGRPVDF